MLRVALTGGIATGKSHVLAEFMRRGVPCIDADELAHGVMSPGTEATRAIAERFGDVLDETGAVDRRRLAPLVFADAAARHDLEAIVHPAVYRAIAAALRGFERLGGSPIAIVDVPLLFETDRQSDFDKVVATLCSEATQRARLAERGLSPEAVDQRLAAQLPADEKARRAEYVIRTGGSYEETSVQIDHVLAELLNAAHG